MCSNCFDRVYRDVGRLAIEDFVSADHSNEFAVRDQRELLVRMFGAQSLQFLPIGAAGKDRREIRERRDRAALQRSKRSRRDMAFKLYSITLNDFTIKIGAATGAADCLAGDRADHEQRNK